MMKRTTPLKVKKETSMDKYARDRAKRVKNPSPVAMIETLHEPFHDPESDLHYLTHAEEVRSDPRRHRAAKLVAQKKIKRLKTIA